MSRCGLAATSCAARSHGLEGPADENGSPKLDKYNQDESVRSRPILGIFCETQTWTRVR